VTGNVKEVKAVLSELAASFGSSPSGHVQVTSNRNIPSPVNVVSSYLHDNLYLAHESTSCSSSTTPPWNPTLNDGLSAGNTSIESSFAPPPNNTFVDYPWFSDNYGTDSMPFSNTLSNIDDFDIVSSTSFLEAWYYDDITNLWWPHALDSVADEATSSNPIVV